MATAITIHNDTGARVIHAIWPGLLFNRQHPVRESMDNDSDNSRELNDFLKGVERRAFRMAEMATGSADHALDIVQDAMMVLVRNYRHKRPKDWGPLFHTIMQSRIRDWYRRSSIRNRLFGWLATDDERGTDPMQQVEDAGALRPEDSAGEDEILELAIEALRHLPLRQQQTFLLRAWEGYSTAETARIMKCSQGTVKTHYSRAVRSLRERLEGSAHE